MNIVPKKANRFMESNGIVRFERRCQVTNQLYVFKIPQAQVFAWESGKLIQDAMPQLSVDEREILIHGFTPAEWRAINGEKI